jgi:hypothetical protein
MATTRVTTMNDAILDVLASQDPDLHHRVLEALVGLSEGCRLATARYEGLPVELLESLAHDKNSSVRHAIAGNPAAPVGVLVRLASDPDEWVRFMAYRNPSASDETRAAATLLGVPSPPSPSPERDPQTPPEELRRIADAALANPNGMRIRSDLAANPNLPEDLIPALVEVAWVRWEWGSLWGRRGGMWPSTWAFTEPESPPWLLAALAQAGHPAALIHTGLSVPPSTADPADALAQLIDSELLIRALWRELAHAGVVELEYWNDSSDGDHFFASSMRLDLMEGNTAAEYIVGGYSDSREWIQTSDDLPVENVTRLAASVWDDWTGVIEEFSLDDLDLFTLGAASYMVEKYAPGGANSVRLTSEGQEALMGLVARDVMSPESDDFETTVTVRDSRLPGICFGNTTDEQKRGLVALVRASRSDPMLSRWGISNHFLKCIALHPSTPADIRTTLAADSDAGVREAAKVGAGEV